MATTYMTNARLDANSARAGQDYQDVDTLRIIGQKPTMSAAESEIQRILETRAAQERAAQLERPIYGMWTGDTFVSTDPNEIAEINARAEMRRTGLDRYYKPQSGAYFEAFNKIRDRYLQQELGKKAAVEAEGRAIVANRLGAFDNILKERAEAEKNKELAAKQEEQRKKDEAKAIAASRKDEKAKLAAMADDARTQLNDRIKDLATSEQDRKTYLNAINKINDNLAYDFQRIDKGEEPTAMREFFRWQANPTGYKIGRAHV